MTLFLKLLAMWYIRKKYGDVYLLKPPLGLSPFDEPCIWERMKYSARRRIWNIDKRLDRKYGLGRRLGWLARNRLRSDLKSRYKGEL